MKASIALRAVRCIALAGWWSLLAGQMWAAAGDGFSFGSNFEGQTGLATDGGNTLVATPIDTSNLGSRKVAQIATGLEHSLALADDGTVFSFGWNINGQTGQGVASGSTLVQTPIDTTNLGGSSITQVSAGGGYSLLLADDGSVFSFGVNSSGRTGVSTTSGSTTVATPINTSNLGGRQIVQVAAGFAHSLLLADDGTVFSFGSNGSGQTGLGTDSGNTTVATAIDTSNLGGRSIVQIAAGDAHSLLLADDGSVFSFGLNGQGRTGLGTDSGNTTVATAIDTSNLSGRSITEVAAGGTHSLLLADDGGVFSFGTNFRGVTGLGTETGITTVATAIDTSNLGSRSVEQLDAGFRHNLLLADDGTVFSFGTNEHGRTGLNSTVGNTLVATAIDASNLGGYPVIDLSAGGSHSLLVAVPEPTSVVLALFGLLSAGRLMRRQKYVP